MPPALLKAVDRTAKQFYASRSEYIRDALVEQLRVDKGESSAERRRTYKRLPRRMIRPSTSDEEFDLAEEYRL